MFFVTIINKMCLCFYFCFIDHVHATLYMLKKEIWNKMTKDILSYQARGDRGTLRRKNSNPPNIDLIFKIKDFDDTYGYSIQWGIFEQEMKFFRNV